MANSVDCCAHVFDLRETGAIHFLDAEWVIC